MDLERKNAFAKFIRVRERFELLLIKYDYIVQQIVRKYRGAFASYPHIKDFYFAVMAQLEKLDSIDDVIEYLSKTEAYNYISLFVEDNKVTSADFSSERKSAVYIREALASAPKCRICNGFIHRNSISIDHITRKQDGGLSEIANGQLTHPYCNTAIKN